MKTAIVFGGCGTFGSIVARDLARRAIPVVVAGRDAAKNKRFAAELGAPHRAMECDVKSIASCREALTGCGGSESVAVNCAGPFSHLGPALLEACLEVGCHYCDINDDRSYFKLARGMNDAFAARGLAAVCGCASLPAISGALAIRLRGTGTAPERARATLFIGNRNPKGFAAINSAVESLNRLISAPQGIVYGFRDGETIPIPQPFGPRAAYNFESPEYDLFPKLLGVSSVSVKVGFELRLSNGIFNALAHLPQGTLGSRFAQLICFLGNKIPDVGCSGGAIVTELFWSDGRVEVGTVSSATQGQKMAVMPCIFVAFDLCTRNSVPPGFSTAYAFLGANTLLSGMEYWGFSVQPGQVDSPPCDSWIKNNSRTGGPSSSR